MFRRGHAVLDPIGRRRHKDHIARTCSADSVLGPAKFSRRFVTSPALCKKYCVFSVFSDDKAGRTSIKAKRIIVIVRPMGQPIADSRDWVKSEIREPAKGDGRESPHCEADRSGAETKFRRIEMSKAHNFQDAPGAVGSSEGRIPRDGS